MNHLGLIFNYHQFSPLVLFQSDNYIVIGARQDVCYESLCKSWHYIMHCRRG